MAKTELMVTTRPLRYCFFVSDTNLEQFHMLALACCAQWGGINNLILPVDIGHERVEDIQTFLMFVQRRPDYFVAAISDVERASDSWKKIAALLEQRFADVPLLSWEEFRQEEPGIHPVSFLSSDEAFTTTYDDSTLPFQPANLTMIPTLTRFVWSQHRQASDLLRVTITTTFGDVTTQYQSLYPPLRFMPIDGLEEAMLRAQMSKGPLSSIVNLTLKNLKCLTTVSAYPSLAFDVVIAKGVRDLCRFWNLRALSFGTHWLPDRRVILLTKEQFLEPRYYQHLFDLIQKFRMTPSYLAEQIQQRAAEGDLGAKMLLPDLDVVFHFQQYEEIQMFLREQERLMPISGRSFQTIHSLDGSVTQYEERVDEEERSEGVLLYAENRIESIPTYLEYGGVPSSFFADVVPGPNTLHLPSSQLHPRGTGEVRKDIRSSLWQSYLPTPAVASLIIPASSFVSIDEHIEASLSYPSTISGWTTSTQRVTFQLPSTMEMYQAHFGALGYEVGPSDKMTYVTGLLNLAGGLEQATIFRSRTTYKILDALAVRASQKLARELLRAFPPQQRDSFSEETLREMIAASALVPRFQRNPRTLSELKGMLSAEASRECLEILGELVRMKAIQRGWLLQCPHCHVQQWYGLGILDEKVNCQGCLEPFEIPLKASGQADTDRPMQYTLNPLTDRAMDQDVFPVVLALLALRTQHASMTHVVPGMNFKARGEKNTSGDFDFLYVYQQQLYGGECKSGQILKSKDIQTAVVAKQLGFRAFFFATISHFSDESKQLISEFQQSLRENEETDRPFGVFLLEEQALFSGQLPVQIPQIVYQDMWSQGE